jgi:signal transduction histidine kinase
MSSIPPPIHITRLEVNVRPVQINNPLTFSHDLDTWTFKFVGISFREDSGLRYQYRLLDHNPEWSPPDAQRTVTLAELPPNTYRFEVRAIDSKGLQSVQPAWVAFTILPPFWKTWWAYFTYGVLMLAAVVLWRRHEIRKIRRKEREEAMLREVQLKAEMAEVRARAAETKQELEKQQTRMQIARDLHDEVGSTLSSITLFAQAIRKGDKTNEGNSGKLLSLISESSSYAKEAISDIIWAIDPGNDSWENLTAKLRRYASDLLESKKIVHTIEMDVPSQPCSIDPQRRRHLWLLFKEIITNVVKHSSCTEAHVRLSIDESHITITVEDNGVGFDSNAVHEGNGLRNIRSRGEILGAGVGLASKPGAGTRWTIGLRL